MKRVAFFTSWLGLLITFVPSLLYFANRLDHTTVLTTALLGTVIWFASTPVWMSKE